ncbi:MAG: ABC transporter ATP-binding protein, partial [Candidatus Rokuibacteriota bacterium]
MSGRETPARAAEALVRFVGVDKTFDGQTLVIEDLNLDIQRGEFLTLLGPSGSGKTTTLMMLAGFEVPTRGDIRLGGRSIRNLPPYKRGIGVVFQNYALFPHMTVRENVAFPLLARRTARAEIARRVAQALEMVQLRGFETRRPGQLSGGQQQRVALARALVFSPELVLMDEPLGALDKQLRERMQIEVKHIHERIGVTVVYVTHDQSEALTMSDRIAVFRRGRIEQLATPAQLYEEPENSFVAQFVGESNRLPGKVVHVTGGECLVEVGGESVRALPVKIEGPGGPTLLSIRPEGVEIDPDPDRCPNVFPARIRELIYLGDHTRVRVSVCGHDDFVIRVKREEAQPLAVDQGLRIGWAVE